VCRWCVCMCGGSGGGEGGEGVDSKMRVEGEEADFI
jgi:hypothetical protein